MSNYKFKIEIFIVEKKKLRNRFIPKKIIFNFL
jgi:hypothetical protein